MNSWEKLDAAALERIRGHGYGEGGTLWLCVNDGMRRHVVQGDYAGLCCVPGAPHERFEAFESTAGQLFRAENVSHTMPFQPPDLPDDLAGQPEENLARRSKP